MLIIAHRLATIKNCDMIIVLDEGEIIEQGTHQELLEKEGQYYRLWQMQQGNYESEEVIDHEEKEIISNDIIDEEEMTY